MASLRYGIEKRTDDRIIIHEFLTEGDRTGWLLNDQTGKRAIIQATEVYRIRYNSTKQNLKIRVVPFLKIP
jgi:hypothetical protein